MKVEGNEKYHACPRVLASVVFRYRLFRWCSAIRCSVFRWCSVVPALSRFSAGVPCSVVPCSGVPGCIVCLKTVTLYKKLSFFSLKVLKARKEAGNNFALLCESRKMADQLKKAYLHRSFKILHFFTPARIQK